MHSIWAGEKLNFQKSKRVGQKRKLRNSRLGQQNPTRVEEQVTIKQTNKRSFSEVEIEYNSH